MRPEEKFIELQSKLRQDMMDTSYPSKERRTFEDNIKNDWNKWFEENQKPELNFQNYNFDRYIYCCGWHFSKLYFANCNIKKIEFVGCEFEGAVGISDCNIDDIELELCNVKKESGFHKSHFKKFDFDNSSFQEGFYFSDNIVEEIRFEYLVAPLAEIHDSEFKKANFNGARIDVLYLRNCIFDKVKFFRFHSEMADFFGTVFRSAAYFEECKFNETDFENSSFELLVLDASHFSRFKAIPDFSRTIFKQRPIIEEIWTLPKSNSVASSDVNKYRFLKDYFQKNNDHSKEMQYFALEMMARRKGIKQPFERALFWLYEKISNYGQSIAKPIFWLFLSFVAFSFSFSDYSAVTEDNFGHKLADIFSFTDFKTSFVRTIFPLANLETFNIQKKFLNTYLLTLQTVISISLLFLLVLGIRNKFKIK